MKSAKGSAWERQFCKLLSGWWTGDPETSDSLFWRTAGSGGRATVRAKKGLKTAGSYGDITSVDPRSAAFSQVFTVELKRGYPAANIHAIAERPAKSKPSMFEEWIDQAVASQKESGTPFWLLVHKHDSKDAMVYLEEGTINDIQDSIFGTGNLLDDSESGPVVTISYQRKGTKRWTKLVGLKLERYLALTPPERIKEYAKQNCS